MEIFKIGSEVTIKKMIIDGVLKSVTIGDNDSVQYFIGWFSGDTYMTGTFNSFEVSGKPENIRKLGFK